MKERYIRDILASFPYPIVAFFIQQMICAQWADEMCRCGSVPYFLLGNYRKGRIFNPILAPLAEKRGY
jgi:hypothetical protein